MTAPSIGRVVHYVSYGTPGGEYTSQCRTAHVTEVEEPSTGDGGQNRVGLCVMNPTGLFFHSLTDGGCGYDADKAGGTWHWPERV